MFFVREMEMAEKFEKKKEKEKERNERNNCKWVNGRLSPQCLWSWVADVVRTSCAARSVRRHEAALIYISKRKVKWISSDWVSHGRFRMAISVLVEVWFERYFPWTTNKCWNPFFLWATWSVKEVTSAARVDSPSDCLSDILVWSCVFVVLEKSVKSENVLWKNFVRKRRVFL